MASKNQVAIFITTVLLLSSTIAAVAHVIGNENFSILSVFTPSLIALFIVLLSDGKKGLKHLFVDQFLKPVHWRWLLTALLLFPLTAVAAVGLHSLFGGPALELRTTQLLPQAIVILLISLGEEFGWRGFLLPKLQIRYTPVKASLILGLVWGVWHFPASLIGTGVPQEMPFLIFMIWVIMATLVMTWVYNKTGSVLTAILMHTTANATFNYLPLLPEFVGQMKTFSIFLSLLGIGIISYGLYRRA